MTDEPHFCSYRWRAPRVEVPDSVPVEHVCMREHHEGFHICSCTAYSPPEGAPMFRIQVE